MRNSGAYIGGTFDLFHYGHVRLFQAVQRKYGYLVVSLNRDEFCARYKRPAIMTFLERAEVISACKYVDKVMENVGDEDSKPAILASGRGWVIHGDDWTGETYMRQLGVTQKWLDEHKIRLAYMPYTAGISTSGILKRVRNA